MSQNPTLYDKYLRIIKLYFVKCRRKLLGNHWKDAQTLQPVPKAELLPNIYKNIHKELQKTHTNGILYKF